MPADIELGVTFDTDQAVKDLENDLDDVDVGATSGISDVSGGRGSGGAGGGLAAGLGAEAGSDVATGGKKGGILGGLAGGLSKTVVLLGAIVGFLALLEPVQKALGFITRQFELLLVPVLVALRPFLAALQKLVVKVLQFLRNPDSLFESIKNALAPFANTVIGALNNLPGVNLQKIETSDQNQSGFRSTGTSTQSQETAEFLGEQTKNQGGVAGIVSLGFNTGLSLISDDASIEKLSSKIANDIEGNLLE